MLILALETSTPRLSLALAQDLRILAHSESWPERRPAEILLPELQKLFHRARVRPRDLEGVAVGLGPGSFTGLRVGVSTAQGLAQSLRIPAAGLSSFQVAAAGSGADTVLVVADAHRDLLYAALYQRSSAGWEARLPESLLAPEDLRDRLPAGEVAVTGPAAEAFFSALPASARGGLKRLPATRCLPGAEVLARLAEPRLRAGGVRPEDLQPLYLRRTQAEEVRARGGEVKSSGGDRA